MRRIDVNDEPEENVKINISLILTQNEIKGLCHDA